MSARQLVTIGLTQAAHVQLYDVIRLPEDTLAWHVRGKAAQGAPPTWRPIRLPGWQLVQGKASEERDQVAQAVGAHVELKWYTVLQLSSATPDLPSTPPVTCVLLAHSLVEVQVDVP